MIHATASAFAGGREDGFQSETAEGVLDALAAAPGEQQRSRQTEPPEPGAGNRDPKAAGSLIPDP